MLTSIPGWSQRNRPASIVDEVLRQYTMYILHPNSLVQINSIFLENYVLADFHGNIIF